MSIVFQKGLRIIVLPQQRPIRDNRPKHSIEKLMQPVPCPSWASIVCHGKLTILCIASQGSDTVLVNISLEDFYRDG